LVCTGQFTSDLNKTNSGLSSPHLSGFFSDPSLYERTQVATGEIVDQDGWLIEPVREGEGSQGQPGKREQCLESEENEGRCTIKRRAVTWAKVEALPDGKLNRHERGVWDWDYTSRRKRMTKGEQYWGGVIPQGSEKRGGGKMGPLLEKNDQGVSGGCRESTRREVGPSD